MTNPAGQRWTRRKPTEPGWYWFRDESGELDVIIVSEATKWDGSPMLMAACMSMQGSLRNQRLDRYSGEFQGPLTPNEATE